MRQSYEFKISNGPNALSRLKAELDSSILTRIVEGPARMAILVAADELVSNILKHGFLPGMDQLLYLQIQADDEWIEIKLRDNGKRFNPLAQARQASLNGDLASREPGGLGIYLTLSLMDESEYEWNEPWNCLTLRKKVKSEHG
ncbi:MAG: ATP-binding protein [Verrucomicrobia bacterium]|nr:ATP-binding protein [Verrucomicrobiota bacterium]MBV9674353.1 ATP-binding protein [Verrucomicrobiota bacterium]